jgi:hypothetical protein
MKKHYFDVFSSEKQPLSHFQTPPKHVTYFIVLEQMYYLSGWNCSTAVARSSSRLWSSLYTRVLPI